ncbi:hypothetical protein DPMN_178539 [Dreissena polymorpha]|uniref:Uncharacterized protein n=1 Tax=Dreissena polymorpha TaxID=45954 RepID=A0A9D4EB43_DREPO|nr:hypothetical protein DPMN_178539 [Dreissena polymorpha]
MFQPTSDVIPGGAGCCSMIVVKPGLYGDGQRLESSSKFCSSCRNFLYDLESDM